MWSLFITRKTFSSFFSEAVSEGIKDAVKEMGYGLKKDERNEECFSDKKQKINK